MKIAVFSDLHVECLCPDAELLSRRAEALHAGASDADVVVLAGDTHTKTRGPKWAAEVFPGKKVVMVAGNHEFYGSTLEQETQALQKAAASTSHVNFLENEILEIGGVVFLGCCLWTDFALFGVAQRTLNIIRAERQMSDYSLIHSQQRNDQPAVPEQTFALHRESLKFLREGLERFANQHVVVVTHHAPSARSISKLHQGSPLNPAFASPLEWLFEKFQPTLWIHGHTHGPADYTIGNTRILANCAGYPGELSDDDFRPDLIVEIAPE